jgi:hypothetical protein
MMLRLSFGVSNTLAIAEPSSGSRSTSEIANGVGHMAEA